MLLSSKSSVKISVHVEMESEKPNTDLNFGLLFPQVEEHAQTSTPESSEIPSLEFESAVQPAKATSLTEQTVPMTLKSYPRWEPLPPLQIITNQTSCNSALHVVT